MARRYQLIGLLFAGGACVSACADATTVDVDQVVASIPAAVSPDAPGDVTDVTCPPEIERGTDVVVTCTALLGEDDITVRVTQTNNDGALEISVVETLLGIGDIEAQARNRFGADLSLDDPVVCEGTRLRVLDDGFTMVCSVDADDEIARVFDVVVAADATYRVELR